MLRLLSEEELSRMPLNLNGWERISEMFSKDISRYKREFKNNVAPLGNNYIFSLMMTYGSDVTKNLYTYINESNKAIFKSFTSDFANRTIIENILPNTEVSLYVDLDNTASIGHWEDMEPLKIINTAESELLYFDFLTEQFSEERVYMELSVSKLFFMYKKYYEANNKDGYSIEHFITAYVYPNLIKSYINLILWNTFSERITEPPLRTPIQIAQHIDSEDLMGIYEKHREEVFRKREVFTFYPKSIPLIESTGIDITNPSRLSNGYRQVFDMTARLSFVFDMWDLLDDDTRHLNMYLMRSLKEDLNRLESGGFLTNSPHTTESFTTLIDRVKKESK